MWLRPAYPHVISVGSNIIQHVGRSEAIGQVKDFPLGESALTSCRRDCVETPVRGYAARCAVAAKPQGTRLFSHSGAPPRSFGARSPQIT
jgi:hypothetical protein